MGRESVVPGAVCSLFPSSWVNSAAQILSAQGYGAGRTRNGLLPEMPDSWYREVSVRVSHRPWL